LEAHYVMTVHVPIKTQIASISRALFEPERPGSIIIHSEYMNAIFIKAGGVLFANQPINNYNKDFPWKVFGYTRNSENSSS